MRRCEGTYASKYVVVSTSIRRWRRNELLPATKSRVKGTLQERAVPGASQGGASQLFSLIPRRNCNGRYTRPKPKENDRWRRARLLRLLSRIRGFDSRPE